MALCLTLDYDTDLTQRALDTITGASLALAINTLPIIGTCNVGAWIINTILIYADLMVFAGKIRTSKGLADTVDATLIQRAADEGTARNTCPLSTEFISTADHIGTGIRLTVFVSAPLPLWASDSFAIIVHAFTLKADLGIRALNIGTDIDALAIDTGQSGFTNDLGAGIDADALYANLSTEAFVGSTR